MPSAVLAAADLSWHLLGVDAAALEHYRRELGASDAAAALEFLARAIAASPVWAAEHSAALVLRTSPEPALALVGRLDPRTAAWVRAQAEDLTPACARLRYLGYADVERASIELAARLEAVLGREEIARARFAPVPRGGHVVLGLLASILDLSSRQLGAAPPSDPDELLVLVDDCALTGFRLGQCLAESLHRRVVFAHLCSCPELRASVEAAESRVAHCLAAIDLEDHTPEGSPPGWRQEWLARMRGRRYWVGRPDALCFPWGEADRSIQVEGRQKPSLAWRLVPPELCLKNRPRPQRRALPLSILSSGDGPLSLAAGVFYLRRGTRVWIGHAGTGESFVLEGVAGELFRGLVHRGDLERTVRDLLPRYEVEPAVLRADARLFLDELMERSLVEDRRWRTSAVT